MGNHFWFYSTIAQVFAALWAVTGMFAVFRLELLDRKIKDALLSLLNFMLVRFKSDEINLIDGKSIAKLNNIKGDVIRKVKDDDKKEYFGWDVGMLLNRPPETKYIIGKYDDWFDREVKNIERQKKGKNKLTPNQEENQALTEKIIREYHTRKNIYHIECNYKDDLIGDLIGVTIVDGLIVIISVFVLFFLREPLLLKWDLAFIQVCLLLISITAIILSARFILLYCRRRQTR